MIAAASSCLGKSGTRGGFPEKIVLPYSYKKFKFRPANNITEIGDDLPYFFAHHTVTAFVTTDEECEEQMRFKKTQFPK